MVSPIIGASRPEQVRENASASQVKLSHDDLQHIESILQPASTDTEQEQIAMLV